jgi:tRNA G18 (ribose-2'-O)-methylase SpoU
MADVAKSEEFLALVLGNEPHGLTADVLAACAGSVTVETTGNVDSLNVAVAGSVALYEACRSRGASDA